MSSSKVPSLAQVLRALCKENGLSTSGASTDLICRINKNIGSVKKATMCSGGTCWNSKSKSPVAKKKGAASSKKRVPSKTVKGKGQRLSASYYYHEICGGKLYNCEPQWILQPNGEVVLKKIKMGDDAWGGRCPKWVKV